MNEQVHQSLKTQLRAYFMTGNRLTVLTCMKLFHTNELRHFVAKLRKEGIPIRDEWNEAEGKRWKVYFI